MSGTSGTSAAGFGSADAAGWGAQAVSVSYGTGLALDRVSLPAPPGQVTVVVGGDGAGKTTLLRCLAGAQAPGGGAVRTPGPRRIGYLPASSGIYPDLTVAENLAFRAAAYGQPAAVASKRAAELIERAGLTGARDRLAGQLSGGMRQKLGVIAALLHEPDLLILDEPTTGVDPVSRAGLWRLIASAAAAGAAVVLATTYLDEAQRASSVLALDGGRELGAGTPDEIVGAMPGSIVTPSAPVDDPALRARRWRRNGRWRVWVPPGAAAPAGQPVRPDLQDAVTVAALRHEIATQPASTPGPTAAQLAAPGRRATADTASPEAAPDRGTAPESTVGGTASPANAAPAGRPERVALAECVAVSRRFGRFTAVREVSLRVEPGEIVGLLGANGAGKTTLIRMLLGLLPASGGTIALFGEPPSRGTRRRIGYVPQGLGLYDDLTVAENLSFSAAVFGVPPRSAGPARSARLPAGALTGATAAEAAFGQVPVGRLPLGLQRRAAFAQALAHQPDLLILDEPTSGVDPLGRARLWDTVRSAAESGAGVLVTTHYLEEASECDRLVIMADGAVVAEGTSAEVIGDATVTVVRAPAWRPAFAKLEDRGLDVTLSGNELRLPSASPAAVREVLAADPDGGIGSDAGADTQQTAVLTAPATLEERFFQLVQRSQQAQPDQDARPGVVHSRQDSPVDDDNGGGG
jgi:ABC-2 type transport system ATP-binding protein